MLEFGHYITSLRYLLLHKMSNKSTLNHTNSHKFVQFE
nr:MAG TPA: hypothetical protein [Caudoviricetes sp.]